MTLPVLEQYLARLPRSAQAGTRIWLDDDGRAQGRYFNCTLTSAFQPVRALGSDRIVAYEAFTRSYSEADHGLSLWKLLDHAANEEESIELDRLSRMLHAINYYRQPQARDTDLLLSVHERLLAAVSSNHGIAFRRILEGLGLPFEKVVLQLPPTSGNQGWLLTHVADNYRRNGFRFAVNVVNAAEGLALLTRVRPDVIKVDAREIADRAGTEKLLAEAAASGIRVVFKRVENAKTLATLGDIADSLDQAVFAQGHLLDFPKPALGMFNPNLNSCAVANLPRVKQATVDTDSRAG